MVITPRAHARRGNSTNWLRTTYFVLSSIDTHSMDHDCVYMEPRAIV